MSTENTEINNLNDATFAVNEVSDAANAAESLVKQIAAEVPGAPSITRELREQSMRERAKKERETGKADLKKRHAGINAHIRTIVINERVAGAAFERFFPTIENSIYTISRRGEMFVGKAASVLLMNSIEKTIEKMETQIAADLAAVELRLSMYRSNSDFLKTEYTAPAAVHDVEFRTKLSLRVAQLFIGQDKIIAGQQSLHWNGDIELNMIEEQERKLKKELRTLMNFFAKSLRGMFNKVETSDVAAVTADTAVEELKVAA